MLESPHVRQVVGYDQQTEYWEIYVRNIMTGILPHQSVLTDTAGRLSDAAGGLSDTTGDLSDNIGNRQSSDI